MFDRKNENVESLTEILGRIKLNPNPASNAFADEPALEPELLVEIAKMRSEFERDGIAYTEGALIGMAENRYLRRKYDEQAAELFAQVAAIPQKFARATLKGFDPFDDVQRAGFKRVCRWANAVKDGKTPWMVISGSWGTGKSHLACAALNSLRDAKGLNVRFVACVDLVRAIQGTYRNKDGEGVSEAKVTADLAQLDVLCLDDVAADPSAFESKLLTRILDARYRNDKPTLIVTNLGIEEVNGRQSKFDEYVGPLVASRVRECADYVSIITTDFRRDLRLRKAAQSQVPANC